MRIIRPRVRQGSDSPAAIAGAGIDQVMERLFHRLKFGDLGANIRDVPLRRAADLGARSSRVPVELEQVPALLDREAEASGFRDKAKAVHVPFVIIAEAVAAARRADEADILIIADRLGGQARTPCRFSDIHRLFSSSSVRKRSALPITDTDDRLIASAASIGLSRSPVKG